jgi:hypothetical protein
MEEIKAQEDQPSGLSRRELLKVLAASSGAVAAAAFLPGKWARPLVSSGVLPAHAQSSNDPPIISSLEVLPIKTSHQARTNGTAFEAIFSFYDPLSAVSTAALLYASVDACGQIINGDSIASLSGDVEDPQSGSAYFYFGACPFNGNSTMRLKMKVTGRLSNEIDAPIFQKS